MAMQNVNSKKQDLVEESCLKFVYEDPMLFWKICVRKDINDQKHRTFLDIHIPINGLNVRQTFELDRASLLKIVEWITVQLDIERLDG